jgi:hypothetical protein
MKIARHGIIAALATLLANTPGLAIEGLKLQIHCPDVVLSWPSVAGETYVVQYRPTLDPITPWLTLTNSLPAATGTNITFFWHSNRVACPIGQIYGMLRSADSGDNTLSATSTTVTVEERKQIREAREAARLAELLVRCEAEGREPYEWELKNEPPLPPSPEEVRAKLLEAAAKRKASLSLDGKTALESSVLPATAESLGASTVLMSGQSASLQSLTYSGANSCSSYTNTNSSGFYRVFCPTPVARLDVFGVEQESAMNQLDILANDTDLDDNPILLSYVQPAIHGEIEYSDDATVFRYTPTNTFSGLETFLYSITNDVGGSNTAKVLVFVNAAGNNPPYAAPLVLTFSTNQAAMSFPILTNAIDPDSDALQLVAIEQPKRGMVATNANNEIVYTRTSYYVAQETFFYVLTDGHGGYVKQTVILNQQDDDDDQIPDEWEIQHGLSPADGSDASSDPDGDGLPNLAEYKLDTCPWMADNPLNLQNLATNQAFRDHALIPVPLRSHIDRPALSMLLNGQRAGGSLIKRADGCWYIVWDAGYTDNGTYSLALELGYRADPQPGDLPFVGESKPIVVANDLTFNQLASEFSDFVVFDAKLAVQTAYWRIELFDEQNQYLGYFHGTTTNGTIQGAWDLTDGWGNQLASSHVRTDFYTSAVNGSPPGGTNRNAKRWFIKQIPGGIGNSFVVAWGWNAYTTSFLNNRTTLMLNGVINLLANPARDDEYYLRPAVNSFDGNAFRYDDDYDKEVLFAALKAGDSGNFFWFGHADVDVLQGNHKRSSFTPGDVEGVLQNKKHRSTDKVPRDNQHPYRLVILNGCTTYGPDWANAFGIDYQPAGATNDVPTNYQYGRQSQAFVGWTNTIQVPGLGAPNYWSTEYAEGLANLFSRWMDGYALDSCLTYYALTMGTHGFSGHDSWRVSGTSFMWRTAP